MSYVTIEQSADWVRKIGLGGAAASTYSSSAMSALTHAPSAPVLCTFSDHAELVESLAQFVVKAQKESIQKKGRFTVAVSGGSLPAQLSGLIDRPGVKWDKWSVPLCSSCGASADRRNRAHLQADFLRRRARRAP